MCIPAQHSSPCAQTDIPCGVSERVVNAHGTHVTNGLDKSQAILTNLLSCSYIILLYPEPYVSFGHPLTRVFYTIRLEYLHSTCRCVADLVLKRNGLRGVETPPHSKYTRTVSTVRGGIGG
jgi:hypothetical protein